jgi:Ankyrin repeats (3 copies)
MGDLEVFNTLETAILDWDLGAVEHILESNPTISINTTTHFLRTVLHLAAKANNVDIVRCLLKYGASPEIETVIGDTSLHWAILMGDSLDVVKTLVEAIPNPGQQVRYLNLPNNAGMTALHCSRRTLERKTEDYGITKYLIGAGADTNLLAPSGFSPAHYIAAFSTPDALRALLEEAPMAIYKEPGALAEGKTCLHLAAQGRYPGLSYDDNLDWLLDHAWPDHVSPSIARERDDANMTAWEAAWDGTFSHRVQEIAAFVLKDKRNGTMNKIFDWTWHTPRSPGSPYYSLRCNNVS